MSDTPLPLNEAGTHVHTVSPTGQAWDCPLGYLKYALADGFKLVTDEDAPAVVTDPDDAAPFDPSTQNVEAVNLHLQAAFAAGDVAEIQRVLAAEADGKNRSTITDPTAGAPADDNA